MSLVTVPTAQTVAIVTWLDTLIPSKTPTMLVGGAGVGKTAMLMGKLRSLPEECHE